MQRRKCSAGFANRTLPHSTPPMSDWKLWPALICGPTECMKSAECSPAKHHYDHCVERVTKQQEEGGKAEEDCVEECELQQSIDSSRVKIVSN